MAEGTEGAENFDMANVISRAFQTIGSNALLFLGLALILSGLPSFAFEWWQTSEFGDLATRQANPDLMLTWGYWLPIVITMLVTMVTNAILQASLTRATVQHLSGEPPAFARCLAAGLSMILPMIAIGFLSSLGVGLALILLIVPGIMLAIAWCVVVPVYVQERVGIFGSFGRSADLTRGARWKLFFLFLIVTIGLWVLSIPAGMLIAFTSAAVTSPLLVGLVSAAISSIGSMVMVTIQASAYVELRDVKEGVAPGELEAIFA